MRHNRVIAKRLVVLIVAVLVGLTSPAATATSATPAPTHLDSYVRDWVGHTRDLRIRPDHTATETIYSGCCTHVITLRLALSHVRGTPERGSVLARVTRVHVLEPSFYDPRQPAPMVGATGRLRLDHGVLREPFTHTTYCSPAARPRYACGA